MGWCTWASAHCTDTARSNKHRFSCGWLLCASRKSHFHCAVSLTATCSSHPFVCLFELSNSRLLGRHYCRNPQAETTVEASKHLKRVIIGFRGTSSTENLMSDVDAVQQEYIIPEELDSEWHETPMYTHRGFTRAFEAVKPRCPPHPLVLWFRNR